jgi:hypothetical protein
MHAKPAWLPKGYKNWDALLTAAVRKGMQRRKAPADVDRWTYGSWHVVDIEHPLAPRFCPSSAASPEPAPAAERRRHHREAGRPHFGPSQRFTMDWSNIDGSTENIVLGESGNPLSPYFRDQWNDWYNGTTFALPFTPARSPPKPATRCACCHEKKQGTGTLPRLEREQDGVEGPRRACAPGALLGTPLDRSSFSPPSSPSSRNSSAATPAATTSTSISSPGSIASTRGVTAFLIRTGRPAPTTAPASRASSSIRRSPGCWARRSALILPWHLAPIALTFLTLAATGLATRALALEASTISRNARRMRLALLRLHALHRLRALRFP